VDIVQWDGDTAKWTPPAGHTGEVETPATRAQANADIAGAFAAAAAAELPTLRAMAKDFLLTDPRPEMKAMRGLGLTIEDEVNALRQWLVAFKAAVAASTSLANMQTRVAVQLLNATAAKIAAGSVD
jgi:hypothetical protein